MNAGRKRPFVHVKAGLSLDGRIATNRGQSQWITSEPARRYAHTLRRRYDAILVGISTLLADDPSLNVRLDDDQSENDTIHRVVLDSRLRTPPAAKIFSTPAGGEIYIASCTEADNPARTPLQDAGARILDCRCHDARVDPADLLDRLHGLGIESLLIEGGGEVIASFLRAGLVDLLTFVYAPLIIGGSNARPAVGGPDIDSLDDALKLESIRSFPIGPDIAIEGRPVNIHR